MSTTIRNVSRIFANNRTDRRVDFSRKEVRGVVMGIFWTLMVTVSLVYGAVSGRLSAVTAAALEGAAAAVELVLAMAGALCLWSGVLELMRRSGMAAGLSRLLRPVLRRLLPQAGRDEETLDALSANVSANLLGLGNAATPLGIRAATRMAQGCGGDVRKALNAVELLFTAAPRIDGKVVLSPDDARAVTQRSAMRYDREGDEHYDVVSALMKSLRGSDPDAALHYLARLLEAGDLPGACRRILCSASEDIGMAYPQAVSIVKACVDNALQLGLPEAQLPLAQACILLATAPKSNSGESAIDAAMRDVKAGKLGVIPRTLQNVHYDGSDVAKKGQFYRYPHDYPDHWLDQQYLPDALLGASYYHYGDNKNEQAFKAYWENIKRKHSS
jgi:replication-associated recombination protein RarA